MEGARGRWSPKRGPLAGIETRFLRSYSLTGVQSVVQAQVLNILLRGRKMGEKGANGGRTEIQPTFRRRNGLSGREHLADSSK